MIDNIPRVLPHFASVHLDAHKWTIPEVFKWLARNGNVDSDEMLRTFNCGIGFVLIVDSNDVPDVLWSLKEAGETAWNIGTVETRSENQDAVTVKSFKNSLVTFKDDVITNGSMLRVNKRLPVGVLISGSGTNLQALIDQSLKADSKAEIRLVISNVPGVKGLERATSAGIKSKVCFYENLYFYVICMKYCVFLMDVAE